MPCATISVKRKLYVHENYTMRVHREDSLEVWYEWMAGQPFGSSMRYAYCTIQGSPHWFGYMKLELESNARELNINFVVFISVPFVCRFSSMFRQFWISLVPFPILFSSLKMVIDRSIVCVCACLSLCLFFFLYSCLDIAWAHAVPGPYVKGNSY